MERLAFLAAVVVISGQTVHAGFDPSPQYGSTGTSVDVLADGTAFPAGSPVNQFAIDEYISVPLDAAGKSTSSYNYPWPVSTIPGGTPSTASGVGASAMAELDIPNGRLRTYNAGYVYSGSDSGTYGFVQAYTDAGINDVITIDRAARITVIGHVHGTLSGRYSGNTATPSGQVRARFGFWQPGEWTPDGMEWLFAGAGQTQRVNFVDVTDTGSMGLPSTPQEISIPISFSVDLPTGSHAFSAYLGSSYSLSVLPDGALQTEMAFQNTATFQIYVPEGVTATSDSGQITFQVPEPASLSMILVGGILALRRRR